MTHQGSDRVDALGGELEAAREKRRECERELQQARDLLDSWRPIVQQQERELIDGEARLVESELRAEKLEDALASIRTGRVYRLMRIVWRLRAPFRRDKA
jgi:chromosome segregation ATPase